MRPIHALLVCAALAACGPAVPPDPGIPAEVLGVLQTGAEAQARMEAGRWDDAAELYRSQMTAAAASPDLAGWRDEAAYNLACVLARAGRRDEAAAAFAECLRPGFRAVRVPDGAGGWSDAQPALRLAHLLVDPDLDTIRGLPAYDRALDAYLRVGAPEFDADPAAPGSVAAVVVCLIDGDEPAWPEATGGAPALRRVRRAAPIAPQGPATPDGGRTWVLEDGDARWGADAALAAVAAARARFGESCGDVWLFAVGRAAARVAVTAALASPESVAGFVAIGDDTPVAARADAIATVASRRGSRAPWKVVVGPGDDALATAIETTGATVRRASAAAAAAAAMEWCGR